MLTEDSSVVSTNAPTSKKPFERYQTILDRQPFGPLPVGFDPKRMASEVSKNAGAAAAEQLTEEQEAIQKAVSFSMVNVEVDGSVMVGFTDRTNQRSPKHYYLAVGDSQDGWTVKECEPAKETMTIEKEGVEVTLKLGDQSAQAMQPKKAAASGKSSLANRPMTLELTHDNKVAPLSFRSRRARRQAEDAKAKADEAAREAERKRLADERAQREAAEKAERERERAEQRQQLQAIQEELRQAREARAAAEKAAAEQPQQADAEQQQPTEE